MKTRHESQLRETNETTWAARRRQRTTRLAIFAGVSTLAILLVGCSSVGSGFTAGITSMGVTSWLLMLSLIGLLSTGCGGGGNTGNINAGTAGTTASTSTTTTPAASPATVPVATKLSFLTQPTRSLARSNALSPLTPAPQVAIEDANGNVVTTATNAVTLSPGVNPSNAVLSGTLTVNAVNGIATFNNVTISAAASGYTLVASSPGLTGSTSLAFVVSPLPPAFAGSSLDYFTGSTEALCAVAGDVNGDGIPDLVATTYPNGVVALLGNGDGTFKAPINSPAAQHPSFVRSGDFNGDGKLDLVVTNNRQNPVVSVLLGNGDGTFKAPINFPTPAFYSTSLAVGTLAGHDSIVTIGNGNNLQVLLGNGDSTFKPPANYMVSTGNITVVQLGDINGDGNLDIVTGDYDGSTAVLFGNADGTFQAPQNLITGLEAIKAVTVGDFNGDGHLDIVVTAYSSLVTILGNGDGTFKSPINLTVTENAPASVIAADIDGDGHLDLIEGGAQNGLGLLFGNGDGTFLSTNNHVVGKAPLYPIAIDLNGDHNVDIAVANANGGTISVILGNGTRTLPAVPVYPTGAAPSGLVLADFNGDGIADVAASSSQSANGISLLLGKGDGTFGSAINTNFGNGGMVGVAAADFNGDGKLDVVAASNQDSVVYTLLGNGDGTFASSQNIPLTDAIYPVTGDLNGDHHADIVAQLNGGSADVFLGNGDGTFKAPINLSAPVSFSIIADVNGDQIPDVVTSGPGVINVFLGNGDGTFKSAINIPMPGFPTGVAAGDLNGDGKIDLVASNTSYNVGLSILLGNGDGTFQAPQNYLPFINAYGPSVAIADVNLDGIPDVVAMNARSNDVVVLIGNGDGTFVTPQAAFTIGGSPSALVVGDINHDGKIDVLTTTSYYNSVQGVSVQLHQ